MGIFANSRMSMNVRASGSMDCRYSTTICSICGEVSQRKHKREGKWCEGKITIQDRGPSSRRKKSGGGIGGYGGRITNER